MTGARKGGGLLLQIAIFKSPRLHHRVFLARLVTAQDVLRALLYSAEAQLSDQLT